MIGKHGLTPDPVSYHVCYEYVAGRNHSLNTAFDSYLNERVTVSEEVIHGLFNRHIARGEQKIIRVVREQLKMVLSEINGSITSTDHHYAHSREALSTIQNAVVPGLSEAAMEKIIRNILSEFDGIASTNASFRKQLHEASQKISQLKIKLAQYRREAEIDPLTRIDNRRTFEKKLADTIHSANNTSKPLCLVLADIDHFKAVNDTHGHQVGDSVIKTVASTIKKSIKGRDTVARVGGEEFAILLRDTPFKGAMKLADDIRLSFHELDLKIKNTGERLNKITLSFGVTHYRPGEKVEEFVNRADKAMYQSKKSGRDKITGI